MKKELSAAAFAITAFTLSLASDLPSDFRFAEYLEQDGSGYVDTGVIFSKSTTRVEFKVYSPITNCGDKKWLGVNENVGNYSGFGFGTYGSNWRINVNASWMESIGVKTTPVEVEVSGKVWTFTYEGENPVTYEHTYSINRTNNGRAPMQVMGASSDHNSPTGSRYYYLRIYDKVGGVETLTHDFRPAERLSDGKPGLYDCITFTFRPLTAGKATVFGTVENPFLSSCVLDIVGDPEKFADVSPFYGPSLYASGVAVDATAPVVQTSAEGVYVRRNRGWTLTVTNQLTGAFSSTSGAGTAKSYTPVAGDCARLTWHWGKKEPFDNQALCRIHRNGYTPVEYLEQKGSAYVKAGFMFSKTIKRAEFAVMAYNASPGDKKWLGSMGTSSGKSQSGFGFATIGSDWRTVVAGDDWAQPIAVQKDVPMYVSVFGKKWTFKYFEQKSISWTANKSITLTADASNEFLLFRMGGQSAGTPGAGSRIYCVRIYDTDGDGEKLVHYLHAVTRKTDGAVGYFDTVTETFHGLEAGTAEAGPEVKVKKGLVITFW